MNHASQNTIAQNIEHIRERITNAETQYGREPGSVQLLAVSKTRPIEDIRTALTVSQHQFGENYLQDALPKILGITDTPFASQVQWHFIGPIQSNKTQQIAQHFHWVHSIDRLKIAQRLSSQRDEQQKPLNVCIQINTSGENSKSGVSAEEAITLAKAICTLPHLQLRGLMTIPETTDVFEQQRVPFKLLRELKEELYTMGIHLDMLSMGMTNDMDAAIAEGSTMVRIGTAIFGNRN